MELLTINGMDSREIAELTGKRHDNIVRDIEVKLGQLDGGVLRFEGTYQNDQNGQTYKFYRLPKRECLILASGYSVQLRARIIDRWIELESAVVKQFKIPQTLSEALQLAADQARAIEAKDAKIAQDAPKVEYYENFQESHGNFAISDVAKVMGYSRMEFFTILREKKIIFKRAGKWLPYQEFVSKGYFSVKVGATEETAWKQTRITPKGKTYIASIVPPGPMLHVPSVVDIFAP